ncbi:arginine N-succinyltransferase, partial [Chelativorans intermedius]
NIDELRAVKESQLLNVKITNEATVGKTQYLVANDNYHDYRAMLLKLDLVDNTLNLTHEQAEKLGVQEGHAVRVLSLNPMEVS